VRVCIEGRDEQQKELALVNGFGARLGALMVVPLLLLSLPPSPSPQFRAAEADALHERVLAELRVFTDWLEENRVRGYVGEVGWPGGEGDPDSPKWNELADSWFRAANRSGLWVTVWATGEWWGTDYPLAAYEDRTPARGVDTANTQAIVIERHLRRPGYRRGIAVAGGEFAAPAIDPTSHFSNENPGVYNRAYHYDTRATFDFLAGRGLDIVRIPFRWERLQPRLGGRLDPDELRRLRRVVVRARRAGLRVILDMHNYGAYYLSDGTQGVRRPIGSDQVRVPHFVDVWRRLSRNFQRRPGVIAYGLMNEPVAMPSRGDRTPAQMWELASQRAVRAIRRGGDRKLVMVPGYEWSGAQRWSRIHPRAWIRDPANRFRYEAHHYFDRDNSGTYRRSYDEEVQHAADRGYGSRN
jgi:hypothetical protein